jgi:hypothetical protein
VPPPNTPFHYKDWGIFYLQKILTISVTMVKLFFETINKEILGETLGDFVLSKNQNLTLFQ